ncbi:hypothetical protein T01_1985 [Trichinella spiralis]|uniref:Uncharacterized protein n=1 Tax=Trichinella spiralis TaxID=6334 RepID=A0A0V1BQC9_TRISP|nr:hypothetical protein T01_1985 [Trichinella spiralis]
MVLINLIRSKAEENNISCKMFTFVISFISLNVESKLFIAIRNNNKKENVDYTSYPVDKKAN